MNQFNSIVELGLVSHQSWRDWFDYETNVRIPLFGNIKATAKREFSYDSYNDYAGGDLEIIFQIDFEDGTTKYYRKSGYHDSYGGYEFDGSFDEVKPTVVEIVNYEVVDNA